MKNSVFVSLIILCSVILFVFVYPQGFNKGIDLVNSKYSMKLPKISGVFNRNFQLGLDLLGGTHLVYRADLSKVSESRTEAMQGIRDVIERRVNYFGVAEPLVQISGDDRLIVELAGIQDVKEAIKMIGETPFLEFKEQSPDYQKFIDEYNAKQTAGKATALDQIILQDKLYASSGLNGRHVKRASLQFDQTTGQSQVGLELTDEGTKLFADITKKNLGKPVAIFLDGQPISIPTVQSEITDGKAVISGSFTPTEAKLLATRLNAGALPVPITLISQQTIGASLGAESLAKSLKAGVVGLILVALFMIAFYRLPGITAVIALIIYTLIVLSIYKLLPVTLTLAGISGFILSLGMAVDANVLIFARMREELKLGKPLSFAVHEGFSRAWLSIRDSHVTTLIGAAILYMFTASIVRGFALTLAIGVLTSLFTATVVTRKFLYVFVGPKLEKLKWLF